MAYADTFSNMMSMAQRAITEPAERGIATGINLASNAMKMAIEQRRQDVYEKVSMAQLANQNIELEMKRQELETFPQTLELKRKMQEASLQKTQIDIDQANIAAEDQKSFNELQGRIFALNPEDKTTRSKAREILSQYTFKSPVVSGNASRLIEHVDERELSTERYKLEQRNAISTAERENKLLGMLQDMGMPVDEVAPVDPQTGRRNFKTPEMDKIRTDMQKKFSDQMQASANILKKTELELQQVEDTVKSGKNPEVLLNTALKNKAEAMTKQASTVKAYKELGETEKAEEAKVAFDSLIQGYDAAIQTYSKRANVTIPEASISAKNTPIQDSISYLETVSKDPAKAKRSSKFWFDTPDEAKLNTEMQFLSGQLAGLPVGAGKTNPYSSDAFMEKFRGASDAERLNMTRRAISDYNNVVKTFNEKKTKPPTGDVVYDPDTSSPVVYLDEASLRKDAAQGKLDGQFISVKDKRSGETVVLYVKDGAFLATKSK